MPSCPRRALRPRARSVNERRASHRPAFAGTTRPAGKQALVRRGVGRQIGQKPADRWRATVGYAGCSWCCLPRGLGVRGEVQLVYLFCLVPVAAQCARTCGRHVRVGRWPQGGRGWGRRACTSAGESDEAWDVLQVCAPLRSVPTLCTADRVPVVTSNQGLVRVERQPQGLWARAHV